MEKLNFKETLGCLPAALAWNFLFGGLALILSIALGGPKIYMDADTAAMVFAVCMIPYVAMTWGSIFALARGPMHENLIERGPYAFMRHPMYSAIIFILNPALGLLFRSWLLVLASVPIYFIWRACISLEEHDLEKRFGRQYLDYQNRVNPFFPNLRSNSKPLYYLCVGFLIFTIVFAGLNFPALYTRWVTWETKGEIVWDAPQKPQWPSTPESPEASAPTLGPQAPSFNPNADSIIISKINSRAPLVKAGGTTQTELNAALNQGVIIYPGSAMPGQNGQVFLSGHSSVYPWNKTPYGKIFSLLDKLEKGDTVSLVYNQHQYDYQVTDKKILSPDDVQLHSTYDPTLALMTCWPIGTSLKRLVVYAELVR